VIEGPPVPSRRLDEVRADLEQMLALRDAEARQPRAYAATQPTSL
jgi:hypothetical protein